MTARPVVGSLVHYVAYGTPGGEFPAGVNRAAVVTQVHDNHPVYAVGLCVMNPTGLFFNVDVPYDAAKRPGTWHWPEAA